MMAKSYEDGEEAFTCVNVERPRSSGNSGNSNSNSLTSDDEAIYSAACRAQCNDGQIYIEIGKLIGRPVKVLLVSSPGRDSRDSRSSRLAEATQKALGTNAL